MTHQAIVPSAFVGPDGRTDPAGCGLQPWTRVLSFCCTPLPLVGVSIAMEREGVRKMTENSPMARYGGCAAARCPYFHGSRSP